MEKILGVVVWTVTSCGLGHVPRCTKFHFMNFFLGQVKLRVGGSNLTPTVNPFPLVRNGSYSNTFWMAAFHPVTSFLTKSKKEQAQV